MMPRPSGGSGIGVDVLIGVEPHTGELIMVRSTWNDYTYSWEIVVPSKREKADGMVQSRDRRVQFARAYEQYNADVSAWNDTRGLPVGNDSSSDDSADSVRGDGGS